MWYLHSTVCMVECHCRVVFMSIGINAVIVLCKYDQANYYDVAGVLYFYTQHE